jgi:hypothetical protein
MKKVQAFTVSVLILSSLILTEATFGQKYSAVQGPPSVCRDPSGSLKEGELDVLAIFDNSKSLGGGTNQQRGSDEEGRRFDALDEFLSSFAKAKSSRKKNFGLIKFGAVAEEILPMEEVTRENFEDKAKEIREKIEDEQTQEDQTNYVVALERAVQRFRQKSDQSNCKVLIWFTDGVYDRSNSTKPENDKSDASQLEREVCGAENLADQIQQGDINTFVVYLKGDDNASYERRRNASQNVMQVITGDKEPNFGSNSSLREVSSDVCSMEGRRHLGEVLSARDVSELAGYLVDLVVVADGGKPIVDGDCPIQLNQADSVELPDGHLIEWISVTTWNKSPDIDSTLLKVKANGQTFNFDEIFTIDADSQENERSQRFSIKQTEQKLLQSGWSITSTNSNSTCLRAKVRDLTFKVKRSAPQFVPIMPSDLPLSLHDNQIQLIDDQKNQISVDDALKIAGAGRIVSGRMKVDNYSNLEGDVSQDLMPVKILADGKFDISPAGCLLSVEQLDTDIPSTKGERLTASEPCRIVPSMNSDTNYDVTQALEDLQSKCPEISGGWQLLRDSQVIPSAGVITKGSEGFDLSLQSKDPAPRKNVECRNLEAKISFTSTDDGLSEIPIAVNLNLLKPESALWPLLALLLVMFFTLLSLLVLRWVNLLFIRAPSKDLFFGYVANANLVPGDFDRAAIKWLTATREFEIDATKLQTVKGDENRRSISLGEYRFELRIPRLLRPFEHARLVIVDNRPVVFWRANSQRDGFPLSFTSGIGLIAKTVNVPTPDRPNDVDVVVFVPKRGGESGLDGVTSTIRSNLGDLAPQLLERIRQRLAALEEETIKGQADSTRFSRVDKRDDERSRSGQSTDSAPANRTPNHPPAPPSSRPPMPPNGGPTGSGDIPQPPNRQRPPEPPSRW